MITSTSTWTFLRPARTLRRRHAHSRHLDTPFDSSALSDALADHEFTPAVVHCEEQFIRLAESDPLKLIELIESDLRADPALLTFAAEAAGRIRDSSLAIDVLTGLLDHGDPVVREGAVYGLIPHMEASVAARDAIRELARNEPSPGVLNAARDALMLVE